MQRTQDLGYEAITKEGRKFNFIPTPEKLYTQKMSKSTNKSMFGEVVSDNGEEYGEDMRCMRFLSNGATEDAYGIAEELVGVKNGYSRKIDKDAGAPEIEDVNSIEKTGVDKSRETSYVPSQLEGFIACMGFYLMKHLCSYHLLTDFKTFQLLGEMLKC